MKTVVEMMTVTVTGDAVAITRAESNEFSMIEGVSMLDGTLDVLESKS